MPAAFPELQPHQEPDTSLLSHPYGVDAQQQAGVVHQCGQPQAHSVPATGEGSTTAGSRSSLQLQQRQQQPQQQPGSVQQQPQQRQPGNVQQQHSPSSRQSAMQSPSGHKGTGSMPWSVHASGHTTSPSSQQASNSVEADIRQVAAWARPAASLVTQCADAGSRIKQGAKAAGHDSPLGRPLPSQKLPGQSGVSSPITDRSAPEFGAPQGKERPGPSGWGARVKKPVWAEEDTTRTTTSISSSSSSNSLEQQCSGAASSALSAHHTASQSMMLPLELPSPLPGSTSEGSALSLSEHVQDQAWVLHA